MARLGVSWLGAEPWLGLPLALPGRRCRLWRQPIAAEIVGRCLLQTWLGRATRGLGARMLHCVLGRNVMGVIAMTGMRLSLRHRRRPRLTGRHRRLMLLRQRREGRRWRGRPSGRVGRGRRPRWLRGLRIAWRETTSIVSAGIVNAGLAWSGREARRLCRCRRRGRYRRRPPLWRRRTLVCVARGRPGTLRRRRKTTLRTRHSSLSPSQCSSPSGWKQTLRSRNFQPDAIESETTSVHRERGPPARRDRRISPALSPPPKSAARP